MPEENEDVVDADLHDPSAVGATTGVFHDVGVRAYALCRKGYVVAMCLARHGQHHPFDDVEMGVMGQAQDPQREHVIDVTGAVCHPGYLVDNKGNVTPSGTRELPLTIDEPAYQDTHVVAPIPITEHAEIVGRPPVDAPQPPKSPMHTDAQIEARGEDEPPTLPESHGNDHGVVEHHEHVDHGAEEPTEENTAPHE